MALYNDPCAPAVGDGHPRALARPALEGPAEPWDELGPLLRSVRETGEAVSAKDRSFRVERRGRPEEVHFDVSCSAVRDEATGAVGGVLCVVADTTARVLAERRLRFPLALGDELRGRAGAAEVTAAAAAALGRQVGAGRAGYGVIDEAQEVVSVERDWTRDGTVASLAGEARVLDAFGPAVIAELKAGRTLVVEDCRADPRVGAADAAAWDGIGCRSLVVVPLVKDGRLRAVLYLHEAAPLERSRGRAR